MLYSWVYYDLLCLVGVEIVWGDFSKALSIGWRGMSVGKCGLGVEVPHHSVVSGDIAPLARYCFHSYTQYAVSFHKGAAYKSAEESLETLAGCSHVGCRRCLIIHSSWKLLVCI